MIDQDKLALSNELASLLMAAGASSAVNIVHVSRGHDRIDAHLVETFADLLSPLEGLARQGGEGAAAAVAGLIAVIARLQADIFVLKAAQLAPDAAALTDALPTLESVVTMRARQREAVDVLVDLSPRTLGHGWDVEDRGSFFFRWMSPEPRAAIVLPILGDGDFILSARIDALSVEQIDSLVVRVDGTPVNLTLTRLERPETQVHHQADIQFVASATPNGSQFLFIEFEVDKTLCPRDLYETLDNRMLGIGFGHLHMRRSPISPAEPEADPPAQAVTQPQDA